MFGHGYFASGYFSPGYFPPSESTTPTPVNLLVTHGGYKKKKKSKRKSDERLRKIFQEALFPTPGSEDTEAVEAVEFTPSEINNLPDIVRSLAGEISESGEEIPQFELLQKYLALEHAINLDREERRKLEARGIQHLLLMHHHLAVLIKAEMRRKKEEEDDDEELLRAILKF